MPTAGTPAYMGEPEHPCVHPLTAEYYWQSHFAVETHAALGVDDAFLLS